MEIVVRTDEEVALVVLLQVYRTEITAEFNMTIVAGNRGWRSGRNNCVIEVRTYNIATTRPLDEVRLAGLDVCCSLEIEVERAVRGVEACLVATVGCFDVASATGIVPAHGVQFHERAPVKRGATNVIDNRQADGVPVPILVKRAILQSYRALVAGVIADDFRIGHGRYATVIEHDAARTLLGSVRISIVTVIDGNYSSR